MKPSVSPMAGPDWSLLREQIATIQAMVKKRYGAGSVLNQSMNDLAILQRVVDDGVYDVSEVAELTALGTVFGNVVQKQLDFDWVMAEDEGGSEPALRLKTSHSLIVHPLRMVRLKVEQSGKADMQTLFKSVKNDVQKTRIL